MGKKEILVIDSRTGEIVRRIDVSDKSERQINTIENGAASQYGYRELSYRRGAIVTAPVAPMKARHSVTSMDALRRLIAVAKLADYPAFETANAWNLFQGELVVAEMVVRDYIPESFQKPDGTCKRWCGDGECKEACVSPSAPTAAPVAQPALPKLPSTPEEVEAFIGDHFDAKWPCKKLEDARYKLSVHDLLSCFQNLADFAEEQPAQPTEAEKNAATRRMLDRVAAQPAQQVEAVQPPHVWAEAWYDLRNDVLSGVDGFDNDQVNTILGMLDNYEPAGFPQLEAQQAGDVALLPAKMTPEMREAMWEGITRHGLSNLEYWIEDLYNDIRAAAVAQGRKA